VPKICVSVFLRVWEVFVIRCLVCCVHTTNDCVCKKLVLNFCKNVVGNVCFSVQVGILAHERKQDRMNE
jgi:hypothetical protein